MDRLTLEQLDRIEQKIDLIFEKVRADLIKNERDKGK